MFCYLPAEGNTLSEYNIIFPTTEKDGRKVCFIRVQIIGIAMVSECDIHKLTCFRLQICMETCILEQLTFTNWPALGYRFAWRIAF